MDSSTQIRAESVERTLMEDVLRMGTEEAKHELALFNNGDAQSSDSSDDA